MILFLEIDPLNEDSSKPKTVSWQAVLVVLIVLPLVLSGALHWWLGVPDEERKASGIFMLIDRETVPVLESHSLQFEKLFFCRILLKPEGVKPFYDQLGDAEKSVGKAEPPIALKLEREWWDPSETEEGTYYRYQSVTLWSPLSHPDLIYGVVREGDVPEDAKTES